MKTKQVLEELTSLSITGAAIKFRPCVPCHHIREYRYVFGAVELLTGERFFLVMPNCDTNNMSVFLKELSKSYNDDIVILVCYGAVWHK